MCVDGQDFIEAVIFFCLKKTIELAFPVENAVLGFEPNRGPLDLVGKPYHPLAKTLPLRDA
ncbi:hypothetical protein N7476_004954 [Penicillium atrosanguineum]|uniref:Uncharacterized protein n=1 Tax=Penicillium atrosanguineum TaxID=1132637 RepID=A0A9W9U509_9EURO|nr:hypothetical protein N7476_004954 [Penicillium atrosanguineum]